MLGGVEIWVPGNNDHKEEGECEAHSNQAQYEGQVEGGEALLEGALDHRFTHSHH